MFAKGIMVEGGPRARVVSMPPRSMFAGLWPGPVLLNGLNADEELGMGVLGKEAAVPGCFWLRPREGCRMRVRGKTGPSI